MHHGNAPSSKSHAGPCLVGVPSSDRDYQIGAKIRRRETMQQPDVTLCEDVKMSDKNVKMVKFHIRGTQFMVPVDDMRKFPAHSRLGKILHDSVHGNQGDAGGGGLEFFFNRNPTVFAALMDFSVTGKIHLPRNLCMNFVLEEFAFWGLSVDTSIAECCLDRYLEFKEHWSTRERVVSIVREVNPQEGEQHKERNKRCSHKLRLFLEEPKSSKAAQIWRVCFLLLYGLSLSVILFDSLRNLRIGRPGLEQALLNVTEQKYNFVYKNSRPHPALLAIEYLTTIVFILELIIRFTVSPNKKKFLMAGMNVMEFLAILPAFLMFVLVILVPRDVRQRHPKLQLTIQILVCIRVLRVMRIYRMMHILGYDSFKVMTMAIAASHKELSLLISTVITSMFMFANCIYYVELPYDNFSSVLSAFWWAIITMTTVGYGDMHPVSAGGYVIGALCALTGLVVIAMPVPILANNFTIYYEAFKAMLRREAHAASVQGEQKYYVKRNSVAILRLSEEHERGDREYCT